VYEVVLKEVFLKDEQRRDRIVRQTPLGREMLVAVVDPAQPLEAPTAKYRARLVQAFPDRDVAVLKITALASGAPLPSGSFSWVPLANPYAIPLGGDLRIMGYPGKGGLSLTPSHAEFSGFTKNARYTPDGVFKTVASIAGGNSGGAALFSQRLVGIPTLVSDKGEKGADFGYIYPVTWALEPLVVAALRDRLEIPRIERAWVDSPFNTDVSRTRTFLGGTVRSLMTTRPVSKSTVLVHRADRTLSQILALDREIGGIVRQREVRRLLDAGVPPARVASEVGLPLATVSQIAQSAAEPALSDDARRWLADEFFYVADQPGPDGFFLLPVTRKLAVKLVVAAEGFVDVVQDRTMGDGLYEDVGPISLAPKVMRPGPPAR
jgi:Trypsin-like peptidase domain